MLKKMPVQLISKDHYLEEIVKQHRKAIKRGHSVVNYFVQTNVNTDSNTQAHNIIRASQEASFITQSSATYPDDNA